jgi:two-component system response regulator YesN
VKKASLNLFPLDFSSDSEELKKITAQKLQQICLLVAKAPKERGSALILRTREYIETHLDQQLSTDEVAREMAVSPSHFRRIFKDEVGCSFTRYIARLKCEKAKELLRNPNTSIGEVALQMGFKDSNYFSTFFKKQVGASPREFRKNL